MDGQDGQDGGWGWRGERPDDSCSQPPGGRDKSCQRREWWVIFRPLIETGTEGGSAPS